MDLTRPSWVLTALAAFLVLVPGRGVMRWFFVAVLVIGALRFRRYGL